MTFCKLLPIFALVSLGYSQINIPSQATLLNTLKAGHPRLLIAPDGFVKLKQKLATDTLLQRWYKSLKGSADQILIQPVATYDIPDGLRLLATSRKVWDRLHKLALVYRIEGTQNYRDRAWAEIAAVSAFPDWNPKHFLDVAEMTQGFAVAYDWMYDVWTPAERATIRTAIENFGLKTALAEYQKPAGWVKGKNNWNQVCDGGVGMGALAIADESSTLAADVLYRALTNMRDSKIIDDYAPDGGWIEGPGYWQYGTSYTVFLLSSLQTALGSSFGFEKVPGFSEAGNFPIYINGPLNRAFNFADVGEMGPIRDPSIFWMSSLFRKPHYAWHQTTNATPMPLDLFWYDASGKNFSAQSLALDQYFRTIEVITMRSAWGNTNALFAGFVGGTNNASHAHLEMGNFVFDALGYRWASDLGSDNYNLPGYFNSAGPRWQIYRLRAEGNNTLVLGPDSLPDQNVKGKGTILHYGSLPSEAKVVADLSTAYPTKASRYWRGLAMVGGRKALLVQDEVTATAAQEAWWFMHTRAAITIAPDGHSAELKQGTQTVRAVILSPANAQFTAMDALPLPTSPKPAGQNANTGIKKLTIHLSGVTNFQLTVFLVPVTVSMPSAPALMPLGPNWPTGNTGITLPFNQRKTGLQGTVQNSRYYSIKGSVSKHKKLGIRRR